MAGKNILFICSANVHRSPTAEMWFSMRYPENNYESAGSCRAACRIHGGNYVLKPQLDNADRIICMDKRNQHELNAAFPAYSEKTEVAGIPDLYHSLQISLIFELIDHITI